MSLRLHPMHAQGERSQKEWLFYTGMFVSPTYSYLVCLHYLEAVRGSECALGVAVPTMHQELNHLCEHSC